MMRHFYRKCSVVRCREEHSSLHQPPASGNIRTQWIDFIFDGKVPARISRRLYVCAGHFAPDRFTNLSQFKLGLAKKLCLKEGSIPTIRVRTTERRNVNMSGDSSCVHDETSQTDTLKTPTDGSQLQLKTLRPSGSSSADVEDQHESPGGPVEPDTEPGGVTDGSSSAVQETPSYIVSESCLLELFEVCPVCKKVSDVRRRRLGAFVSVQQRCPHCHFSRKWNSQPLLESSPADKLHLSAAVYVTSSCFLKLEEIFQTMQLKMFHSETFQRNSRLYVEPELLQRWKTDGVSEQLRQQQNPTLGGGALDVQQLLVIKEEPPWSSSLDQQDLESFPVKHEEEKRWSSEEEEQQDGRNETEASLPFADVPVKREAEEEEEPPSSQLHPDNSEAEPPACSSTGPPACSSTGPPACSSTGPPACSSAGPPACSSDGPPACSSDGPPACSSDGPPACSSDGPPACSSDGPPACSSDGPPACSSDEHIKTEADGEDCGGPEPARNPDLHTPSEPNTEEKVFEMDVSLDEEDGEVWQKPWSDSESEPDDGDVRWEEAELQESQRAGGLSSASTGRRSFSCDVCGKAFPRLVDLRRHVSVHTSDRPFDCSLCGKKFRLDKMLKSHMKCHQSDKPFGCDICGKKFIYQSCLKSHKKIHTSEKPFACGVCGQKFSTKAHFKRHSRIHTGEKPYACDVCAKTFSLEHHLKRHLLTHRDDKPFGCGICGEKFRRQDRLKKHSRLH